MLFPHDELVQLPPVFTLEDSIFWSYKLNMSKKTYSWQVYNPWEGRRRRHWRYSVVFHAERMNSQPPEDFIVIDTLEYNNTRQHSILSHEYFIFTLIYTW